MLVLWHNCLLHTTILLYNQDADRNPPHLYCMESLCCTLTNQQCQSSVGIDCVLYCILHFHSQSHYCKCMCNNRLLNCSHNSYVHKLVILHIQYHCHSLPDLLHKKIWYRTHFFCTNTFLLQYKGLCWSLIYSASDFLLYGGSKKEEQKWNDIAHHLQP